MPASFLSKQEVNPSKAIQGSEIREGIFKLIQAEHPGFTLNDHITLDELNHYRRLYLTSLITQERGEIMQIDRDVFNAINNNSLLSENIQDDMQAELTFGQKTADKIALFGGSWVFILSFFTFILFWISLNVWFFATRPFDPYPFILLNLLLSCLAAIQAPIIMMSQNRQDQKDRQRSEHDYKINLKAELEIKLLNDKMDHLIVQQSRKLLEIQELQTDYLEDLMKEIKKNKSNNLNHEN